MSGHTMRVTLDRDMVRLVPVCHEPEGAVCRVTCATGVCEQYGYPEHEHGLRPVPCNAVEWLTAGDLVAESCGSDSEVPLYDGMPIEVSWEGVDVGYSWVPAPPPCGEELVTEPGERYPCAESIGHLGDHQDATGCLTW